jgi:cytoskeleton protein RodZ
MTRGVSMADETPSTGATAATSAPTAGSLLRQAREAQGMHIAVLAASLKVPQRKLEALERDRLDELPDATFARALAQTVCRALKIDAAPVLALLPRADIAGLDHVAAGLNTPFRDRSTGFEPSIGPVLRHPATIIVLLLAVAALAIWFWPRVLGERALPTSTEVPPAADGLPSAAPAASVGLPASASAAPASAPLVETVYSTPALATADAASSAGDAAAPTLLSLRVSVESWVEVGDAAGRTLLSRSLQPGERVGVDGTPPLRLTIGNAEGTEVLFRGHAVDLQPATRDNVARIELK